MKNRNSLNIMHKGISLISKSWETGDLLREYDKDSHIHYYIQKFWSPTVITKHEINPDTICRYTEYMNFKKEEIWEYDILEYVGPTECDEIQHGIVYMVDGEWVCQIGRQAPMPLWECMDDMVRVGSYFDENIDYTSDHLAENGNTEHKEGKEA